MCEGKERRLSMVRRGERKDLKACSTVVLDDLGIGGVWNNFELVWLAHLEATCALKEQAGKATVIIKVKGEGAH